MTQTDDFTPFLINPSPPVAPKKPRIRNRMDGTTVFLYVTIISRNLTLENFNSGAWRFRNIDISLLLSSENPSVADQGGPPGVATGPPLSDDGGLVAMS